MPEPLPKELFSEINPHDEARVEPLKLIQDETAPSVRVWTRLVVAVHLR